MSSSFSKWMSQLKRPQCSWTCQLIFRFLSKHFIISLQQIWLTELSKACLKNDNGNGPLNSSKFFVAKKITIKNPLHRSLSYKTEVTITLFEPLEYDYMCCETDFTREYKRIGPGCKVGLLYFLLTACCCSVTKWSNSSRAGSLRT